MLAIKPLNLHKTVIKAFRLFYIKVQCKNLTLIKEGNKI